jgi:hypothetical protein
MNIALWIVQGLAAFAFLWAGIHKIIEPMEKYKKENPWAKDMTAGLLRLLGGLEILGALGLILPVLTHILPWLTPVAAICLGVLMIGAIVVHLRHKEFSGIIAPIIIFLLVGFVAYGRFLLV